MLMTVAINEHQQLVHITEVDKGLACQCVCFECGETVIAKKGEINQYHFAHLSNKESCTIHPESILHKFAKQVILNEKMLNLPDIKDISCEKLWQLDNIIAEKSLGRIRPDLIAFCAGEMLCIEIAVTSFIDKQKSQIIEEMQVNTIEIDLRVLLKEDVKIPSEYAKQYILHEIHNKSWVFPKIQTNQPNNEQEQNMLEKKDCNLIVAEDINTSAHIETMKTNFQKFTFTINGYWVDVVVFGNGGIAVKLVSYNPEIIAQLKQWAREGGGHYNPTYKSWNYNLPFANTVLQRLKDMDTTPQS